jgi:hypothetical protein
MKIPARFSFMILALFLVALTTSCTKDKAEAIKTGALQLRDKAGAALKQVRFILVQNFSMPADDDQAVDKLAAELARGPVNTAGLATLLSERAADPAQVARIDAQLSAIEGHYVQFAKMFDSLPEGSFLAKDAVKKAEKHAANLTVQMINIADGLRQGKVEVKSNPKRILLQEEINALQGLPSGQSKDEAFKRVARRVIELRNEEEDLKQEAIKSALVAAEAGAAVTDLIRGYGRLNVNDMLAIINQSVGFISEITGGNADVTRYLHKYQEIEKGFRADPYWSKLLDNPVIP